MAILLNAIGIHGARHSACQLSGDVRRTQLRSPFAAISVICIMGSSALLNASYRKHRANPQWRLSDPPGKNAARLPSNIEQMKKFLALSVISAALASTGAIAQSTEMALPPSVLQRVLEAGVTIVKTFPVGEGLTGWVLRHPNGDQMVVYTTPGGKYMLAGSLIDDNGTNITQSHAAMHISAPDYAAHLPALRQATAIVTGPESGHKGVVYVFTDPNCTYCAQAYKAFKPYTQAGLQVRYLPVAILGPTSSTKNETILSAADPVAALDAAEMGWPKGVSAAEKVSDRTQAILTKNLELMGRFNLKGTPGIVYIKNGKPVTVGGMPKPDQLASIVANAEK